MDPTSFSRRIMAFTTASALAGALAVTGCGRVSDNPDAATADAAVAQVEVKAVLASGVNGVLGVDDQLTVGASK